MIVWGTVLLHESKTTFHTNGWIQLENCADRPFNSFHFRRNSFNSTGLPFAVPSFIFLPSAHVVLLLLPAFAALLWSQFRVKGLKRSFGPEANHSKAQIYAVKSLRIAKRNFGEGQLPQLHGSKWQDGALQTVCTFPRCLEQDRQTHDLFCTSAPFMS